MTSRVHYQSQNQRPHPVPRPVKVGFKSLAGFKEIGAKYDLPTEINSNCLTWNTFRRCVKLITQKFNVNARGEPFGCWNQFPSRKHAAIIEELYKEQPWLQYFEDDWGVKTACQINVDYRDAYRRRSSKSHQQGKVCFITV